MRVFIVEDSDLVVKRYLLQLAHLDGVEVVGVAATVSDAVEQIPRCLPHAVILDFRLPDGNCLRVLDEIHPVLPHITFIVATSDPSDHNRTWSLAAGARFFFDKAGESAAMFDVIAALARGGKSGLRADGTLERESEYHNE